MGSEIGSETGLLHRLVPGKSPGSKRRIWIFEGSTESSGCVDSVEPWVCTISLGKIHFTGLPRTGLVRPRRPDFPKSGTSGKALKNF